MDVTDEIVQQEVTVETTPQTNNTDSSIKLPGGATLVAVTDRNVDHILKGWIDFTPNILKFLHSENFTIFYSIIS